MAQFRKLGLGLGIVALAASGALAATAGQVIEARQKSYKQIGKSFKAISDELKKDSPSVPLINANARQIEPLSRRLPSWFPKGTGPETGVKTGAMPAIWAKPDAFRQAQQNFYGAAHQLTMVSGKGDLNATKAAVGALGRTCKGCHDDFRAKDKD